MRRINLIPALFFLLLIMLLSATQTAVACGGLFCRNNPVDQNAERIIFTQNKDGTISSIVQIQYTGFDADFSWVLPLPSAITAADVEVPEDAEAAFQELEISTDPVFIPPPMPDCAAMPMAAMESPVEESGAMDDSVTLFASGEVGPYGFDVVGSEDPAALIHWLRDNGYRVTEEMEPLIFVYVEEKMVFLAMKLQPDQGIQDIAPVKVTYRSAKPMIPLRLTAIAANPDMSILTWFYADKQAVPENYAQIEIPDNALTLFPFGGNNYRQLMGEYANEYGGQAFVTEYAAPTHELEPIHPLLQELHRNYAYVTRLNTIISPEEMTVDPQFTYDPNKKDVSNIHDLSNMKGLYDCERLEEAQGGWFQLPLIGNNGNNGSQPATENGSNNTTNSGTAAGWLVVLSVALLLFGAGILIGRRPR